LTPERLVAGSQATAATCGSAQTTVFSGLILPNNQQAHHPRFFGRSPAFELPQHGEVRSMAEQRRTRLASQMSSDRICADDEQNDQKTISGTCTRNSFQPDHRSVLSNDDASNNAKRVGGRTWIGLTPRHCAGRCWQIVQHIEDSADAAAFDLFRGLQLSGGWPSIRQSRGRG